VREIGGVMQPVSSLLAGALWAEPLAT
jgi:hypothetical protein